MDITLSSKGELNPKVKTYKVKANKVFGVISRIKMNDNKIKQLHTRVKTNSSQTDNDQVIFNFDPHFYFADRKYLIYQH